MHLRSITVKGFKSFPDRSKLEFAPGISVIVGPNGSGKSNITDAVLWALGEQSPQAVRGQTMQDVIFAGGHGLKARKSAEVEVVIDNDDGRLATEFGEVSIARHVDRSGQSEYRINGARCRLIDVIEVLSDTGLGKEMHSVVSQGRVEQAIHSKPRDRRLLVEEAAGLGKHRKRRRRAQLKLERTAENLSRVLDVEREARTRLRPLKRQAEAADLHARLRRQTFELEGQLVADALRGLRLDLGEAESEANRARAERDRVEGNLRELAGRREEAERRLAERGKRQEALVGSLYATRSAAERISRAKARGVEAAAALRDGVERRKRWLAELDAGAATDSATPDADAHRGEIAELERKLADARAKVQASVDEKLRDLEREHGEAEARADQLAGKLRDATEVGGRAQAACAAAREAAAEARTQRDDARRAMAQLDLDLDEVEERLARGTGLGEEARALGAAGIELVANAIEVDEGYEAAVAAALGDRLRAGLVADLPEGLGALRSGSGALMLVGDRGAAAGRSAPPVAGAARLLERVKVSGTVQQVVVERLLGDAWIVGDLRNVPADFRGIAVTRDGDSLVGSSGELRRPRGHRPERLLADRNHREQLAKRVVDARQQLAELDRKVAEADAAMPRADAELEGAETALRDLTRAHEQAAESARRAVWLIEQRRADANYGPEAVEVARFETELAARRSTLEQAEHARERLAAQREQVAARAAGDEHMLPLGRELEDALEGAHAAIEARRRALDAELKQDQESGEAQAAELRELAKQESELQAELSSANERTTRCEVSAAHAADQEHEKAAELAEIGKASGLELSPGEEQLAEEEKERIERSIERLGRRREELGPVNPLAAKEYEEAVGHADELKAQREDTERALQELERLIRETDRQIREAFEQTFAETARYFEDMVAHLFPGGHGRLSLVTPEKPRPVLGGANLEGGTAPQDGSDEGAAEGGSSEDDEAEEKLTAEREQPGVEVELTPAGKATRRLSLLSGGEKALAALAFLFAVFLARPCPFYILDEVEAALDDHNIDRFLELLRRYSGTAQFIVVTHQKRTMDVADVVYGVSMGGDGVSKVISRRLANAAAEPEDGEIAAAETDTGEPSRSATAQEAA